jgi:hypothetical protein
VYYDFAFRDSELRHVGDGIRPTGHSATRMSPGLRPPPLFRFAERPADLILQFSTRPMADFASLIQTASRQLSSYDLLKKSAASPRGMCASSYWFYSKSFAIGSRLD